LSLPLSMLHLCLLHIKVLLIELLLHHHPYSNDSYFPQIQVVVTIQHRNIGVDQHPKFNYH
jgi:hypothetical protein